MDGEITWCCDRRHASAGDAEVTVGSGRSVGYETRLVGADLGFNPALILGDSGIHSWKIWLSTTNTETHNS